MTKLLALLVMLVLAVSASGQTPSKVLVAAGTQVIKTVINPGNLFCVGGKPTGLWPQMPPCSAETTRIQFSYRNALAENQQVTGSAAGLIAGTVNVVTHCNLDAKLYGHCWGHFEWEIPEAGGKWEGSWSGMFDPLTNTASYSGTGYGYGGKLEGLRIQCQWADTGPDRPTTLIATISGD